MEKVFMNKAFRFVFALFAFVMMVGVFSLTDASAQGRTAA